MAALEFVAVQALRVREVFGGVVAVVVVAMAYKATDICDTAVVPLGMSSSSFAHRFPRNGFGTAVDRMLLGLSLAWR